MLKSNRVISYKEFKKLSETDEVQVIGFTKLEKYNKKKHSKDTELKHTDGNCYVVKRDMSGSTCKYIDVGMRNFIAVKKQPNIILVLVIVLLLGTIGVLIYNSSNNVYKPKLDGVDIDLDKQPMLGDQEAIDIPGINEEYVLSATKKTINLINPKYNTVYFVYSVYVDGKLIFKTDDIPPNKMVQANLYDLLDSGTYNVTISLETRDIMTGKSASTSDLLTTVIIEK